MGILSRLFGAGNDGEKDGSKLARDAIDWAEDRFPPSLEKFPSTPEAQPEAWRVHAASAGIEIALLFLEAAGQDRLHRSCAEAARTDLASWQPGADDALSECMKHMDDYINAGVMARMHREVFGGSSGRESGGPQADLGFALGMWMWQGVYGRKPTADEGSDMYYLGRFVHASFGNYWDEGVRYVVVTGSPS